jgi:hypothetical protein
MQLLAKGFGDWILASLGGKKLDLAEITDEIL